MYQLKRLWARALAARTGGAGRQARGRGEAPLDRLVLDALGLGLEQTQQHLLQTAPAFDAFERWIVDTTGGLDPELVARINATVTGDDVPAATRQRFAAIDVMPPVLGDADLAHWDERGYVIVHDAVPAASRDAAAQAICDAIGARLDDQQSWYGPNDHGIMVQLFQHPAFTMNRRAARIQKAFAQLWGTTDLWIATDRGGFNPPERPHWTFRGPDLHWDVSLAQPIPFGTQGILYLTDTAAEQGAFTCVPGFHHRIDGWLHGLPPNSDPRRENLHALGAMPIAGRAGDLIIWDQRLPHGSRPNRGDVPRVVQYINMYPAGREEHQEWR